MFDIKVWDDIVVCCNNENVKEEVDNRIRLFYPMNTNDATNKITQVKTLLEIAYTATKSYGTGSAAVIEVLTIYQDVVKSAVRACTTSTNVVIEALSFHKHAVLFAEKGKPRKAIAFLGKCADLARKMSDECGTMVAESENLSNTTRKAITTFAESYVNDAGDQPFAQRLSQLNAYLEDLRGKSVDLDEEIEKAREKAEQNTEVQKNTKERLTSGLMGPISYIGTNSDAKSIQLKLALQKDLKELNNDFVQTVSTFMETAYRQNQVLTSVTCLEILEKIVEKVKRIFVNSKRFWSAVEHTFRLLPSSDAADQLSDDDVYEVCKEAFLKETRASVIGWLTTGNMCRQAALEIRDISSGLNLSRPKLMNVSECETLIEQLSTTLLNEVAEETELVDDVTSDCLYEILVAKVEIPKADDDNDESHDGDDVSHDDDDVSHDTDDVTHDADDVTQNAGDEADVSPGNDGETAH